MTRPALAVASLLAALAVAPPAQARPASLLSAQPAIPERLRAQPAHAGWLLAQAPEPPVELEPPAPSKSRLELEAEYEELEADEIAIGGPVAMVVVGGSAGFLGLFYALVFIGMEADSTTGFGSAFAPLLTLCFGAAAGGALLFTFGIMQLVQRAKARTDRERRMREIRRELRRLPPEPSLPAGVPPSVQRLAPVPLVTVLTF